MNVGSSDGTLIVTDGSTSLGTEQTKQFCGSLGKPCLEIDLGGTWALASRQVREWILETRPTVLNIAGPRESEAPGIQRRTYQFLSLVLPVSITSHSDCLNNMRHWDAIRWIVPFWYITGTLALFGSLFVVEQVSQAPIASALVFWSLVGLCCAFLVWKTMKFHDEQRNIMIARFGVGSLDALAAVEFSGANGWRTATFWFWLLMIAIAVFSLSTAVVFIL